MKGNFTNGEQLCILDHPFGMKGKEVLYIEYMDSFGSGK
jgi:hypothetical protein